MDSRACHAPVAAQYLVHARLPSESVTLAASMSSPSRSMASPGASTRTFAASSSVFAHTALRSDSG